VVISILVFGILTLLAWKAIVTLHDRREFARFQEEFKKSRWNIVSTTLHRIVETETPKFTQFINELFRCFSLCFV